MSGRVLVTGADGTLGRALGSVLGADAVMLDLPELDVTDRRRVRKVVAAVAPDVVVNCAAVTDVDLCQRRPGLALRVNRDGAAHLVETGVPVVTISSDHVFPGRGPEAYVESSTPDPVNEYGRSKLAAERVVLEAGGTVVRTSWLFGGSSGLVPFMHRRLSAGRLVRAVSDQRACATWADDLARGLVRVLDEGVTGVVHMANRGAVTPLEMARMLRALCGRGRIAEIRWADLDLDAPRPRWSVLDSRRGRMLRPLEEAIRGWRGKDG
ncbi:MAG: SDR family oxidoreductase [Candidatus Fermentibacteraceae bacterium]